MTETEFQTWCQKNQISEITQKLISNIRSSDPARRVESKKNNVSGRYPSKKNGKTIQFESHKVELPFIYELEYDERVLEYFDQPPPIKLNYKKKAKNLGVMHTPDFFVIYEDKAIWVECKQESELIKLAEKKPERFILDDSGKWQCPPGEVFAKSYGLHYEVYSSKYINWTFQRNYQFLKDYYDIKK